jgi:RHS repeat-associated protein
VEATYEYDAYGRLLSSTGSVYNPFGYTGEYTDSESGLVYLRARYYDPATQQFLTVDPLLSSTEQAYAYVGGSPVNATDPSGLRTYDRSWDVNNPQVTGCPAGTVDADPPYLDCRLLSWLAEETNKYALAGIDAPIPGMSTRDKGIRNAPNTGGGFGQGARAIEGLDLARKYGYGGKTAALPSGQEVVRFSYEQARNMAIAESGLGANSCPNPAKFVPWEYNGRVSLDGKRAFRVEYDDRSGFHINWRDKTTGRKGHIYVDGTYEQFLSVVKRFNR